MQQKARFTSSSSGCFSVHLLPVVQVWRAGKFYYQSTPSSGALPLMERTMNQRRRIIGRRRPGQGTMTGAPWPITATTAGRSTPPPQVVSSQSSLPPAPPRPDPLPLFLKNLSIRKPQKPVSWKSVQHPWLRTSTSSSVISSFGRQWVVAPW